MPEIIQIEGDLVRVYNQEVVREARLNDLLPHLEHRPPITIGPIPMSARFIHWDESDPQRKTVQIICEQTPGNKTTIYNQRRYVISVPWTYWIFDFRTAGNPLDVTAPWAMQNSRIFWARERVVSLQSEVRRALIPNCDTQGGICYGNTGVPAHLPLDVRVDRLISEFWQTQFTHDSGTGSPWQSETGSNSWRRWDQESRANPNAWTMFPEWDPTVGRDNHGRMPAFVLADLLGKDQRRAAAVTVEGAIPDMITPMTFGRAEEWAAALTPVDRHRLFTALQNMQADDPGALVAPPPAVELADDDLGGEPI